MSKQRLGGGWVRALYSVLLSLALPFIYGYLWWHGRKNPRYRQRWSERGAWHKIDPNRKGSLVIHCVSVGELMAARPLLEALLAVYPRLKITITCTTPTGSELIQQLYANKVYHCYLPFDTPLAVRRFLWRLQPKAILILETEVWPNLVAQSAQAGIPVALINARMSERSARGYQKVDLLMRPVWRQLALVATQNESSSERLRALGVSGEALQTTGNLKFDVNVSAELKIQVTEFKSWLRGRQVITVGSTHEGEEAIILQAFSDILKARPDTLLILVPRHRERFNQVAALVKENGLRMVRRSEGLPVTPETQVLLADSMGEMMLWYGVATIATVGGSLIERGGHNPLEPMAFGLPIVSGRHVFNFADVYQQMDARQAVRWVDDKESLHDTWLGLLTESQTAERIGAQAQQLFARHRGATERTVSAVSQLMFASNEAENDKTRG
ncbi:3-deoxy-D-manno-octulosonic acid transferase [Aliidiomarina minuta]|uniref:3-deoxy-D-manno-octulosonic acid transferase n=1 Tax=Aliidiomarina minuta TaxID=880057 RepID=A0A432W6R5_9GAMM|nr:lipid IV(A) 3-deoxy-D-manno-octulosonic acid transferase [Aliidiomarina minuta]RUO25765.1 3-deoxy-D-manno-octulosonic acid transferase [Aliidiomarina minuta]